jgi:transposase
MDLTPVLPGYYSPGLPKFIQSEETRLITSLRRPTMTLYGGIDLHSTTSLIALLDEHAQIVAEQRLSTDLKVVLASLAPQQAHLTGLVVASTSNGYWLVDGFLAAGSRVHVATTAAIQQ